MKASASTCRDPAGVVRAVVARRPLAAGQVVLALVREPTTEQEVVAARHLPPARWRHLDDDALSRLLAAEALRLPVPPWRAVAPRHSIVTVVVRHGWCVIGPDEVKWGVAWLFSNHGTHAYSGDLILVTEHGWSDFMSRRGGHDPQLAA